RPPRLRLRRRRLGRGDRRLGRRLGRRLDRRRRRLRGARRLGLDLLRRRLLAGAQRTARAAGTAGAALAGTTAANGAEALAVLLGAAHLGAAEAPGALNLHAGRAGTDRGGERALHRAPERDAVLELLGDRLRDELRVELGALDLVDVDVHVLGSHRVDLLAERVHLDTGLADHDPGACRVDVDGDPLLVLADQDVGQARMRELP